MRRGARLAILAWAAAFAGGTLAQPVRLPEAKFNAEIARLFAITETFEGFALGTYPSPLALANGTYRSAGPAVRKGAWCPLSRCLEDDSSVAGARAFTDFPPGTTHWGTNVLYASVGQVLRVTVIGNGGMLVVDLPASPPTFSPDGYFYGFADAMGLLSVTFDQPGGIANYSFDNVVTAGIAQSPSTIGIPTLARPALIALSLMLAVAAAVAVVPHRRNGEG